MSSLFDELDFFKNKDKALFLDQIELIEPRKIIYSKPIAIIYNPNSGKKRNLRPLIIKRFKAALIPYEFLET